MSSTSSLNFPSVPIKPRFTITSLSQIPSISQKSPSYSTITMAPVGLALLVFAMVSAQSLAQQNCTLAITSLSPCLGFITGNSSSTPSSTCCTQLASTIQTQSQCLCTFLDGAPQLPFVVNQTRALTLPGACKIKTTPLNPCQAASGQSSLPPAGSTQGAPAPTSQAIPSAAIAPSPTLPSALTPTSPSTPSNDSPVAPSSPSPQASSGKGTKAVPKTGQSSSAKISADYAPSVLFLLSVASALASF